MKTIKIIFSSLLILIVALIIISAVFYHVKNAETKSITDSDRKAAGGKYVKLSAGLTHYQIAGPDTGKVVLLLHGFSVPYFIWDGTFGYLAARGFKVVRYDMYGRGFSDRPDVVYNKALYMDQITDLIKKLDLKTPVSLAGISFGGEITADFVCLHPGLVNKVVLLDPGYANAPPNTPELLTYFKEGTDSEGRATGQLADFKYPKQHPGWVGKYKVQMAYKGFRNAIISTQYNYTHNGRESSTCLNGTHKPVLLIWGREDETVPFRYSDSIRSVLKADFFPVPDARHLPSIEKPELVNKKMADFLKN